MSDKWAFFLTRVRASFSGTIRTFRAREVVRVDPMIKDAVESAVCGGHAILADTEKEAIDRGAATMPKRI